MKEKTELNQWMNKEINLDGNLEEINRILLVNK